MFYIFYISEYSHQISWKTIKSAYPVNSFKENGFSQKTSAGFPLLKIYNISRLHRGMCQLKKPRANKITEPLAFTVCKLELRGKAIVVQSHSRCTRFNCGQLWAKRKEFKVMCFAKTKTKQGHVLAVVNKGQNDWVFFSILT